VPLPPHAGARRWAVREENREYKTSFFRDAKLRVFVNFAVGCVGWNIRGGADKSLARPGGKQVAATKLGIYSSYSPRSSIHFLACCSKFCKPLKKNFLRRLSVQPGLRDSSDLRVGWKMATFQLFFSVQGTGGSPTGPDPETRMGDQDNGIPGRPVSSGLQGGKKNLTTARVSMLLKLRASPDMLPFSLCNKERLAVRHMNRPIFPTTLSIPSYDIGK